MFKVLCAITVRNENAQSIMWRYKHIFVLEYLAEKEGFGELDFINQIVDNNDVIENSNDLPDLLLRLDKRF